MDKTVRMPDDKIVRTVIITSEDELSLYLPGFTSAGFFVGFDTEWMFQTGKPNRAKIALLKLCNVSRFCLLIHLHRFQTIPRPLVEFLAIRDFKFVGFNITKQLEKLNEDYGLEIRNTVDLNSIDNTSHKITWAIPWCVVKEGRVAINKYLYCLDTVRLDSDLTSWLLNNPWECFGDQETTTEKQLQYTVYSAYNAVNRLKSIQYRI